MEALLDKNRRVPNHKNRVDVVVLKNVSVRWRLKILHLAKPLVSNELRKDCSPLHLARRRCVPCGYAMNYKASNYV